MNEKLQRYIEIRRQIQELEAELEGVKKEATKAVQECEGSKLEAEGCTASYRTRTTWNYSEAVGKANEDLKKLRKEEQESGAATKEEGAGYLVLKFTE